MKLSSTLVAIVLISVTSTTHALTGQQLTNCVERDLARLPKTAFGIQVVGTKAPNFISMLDFGTSEWRYSESEITSELKANLSLRQSIDSETGRPEKNVFVAFENYESFKKILTKSQTCSAALNAYWKIEKADPLNESRGIQDFDVIPVADQFASEMFTKEDLKEMLEAVASTKETLNLGGYTQAAKTLNKSHTSIMMLLAADSIGEIFGEIISSLFRQKAPTEAERRAALANELPARLERIFRDAPKTLNATQLEAFLYNKEKQDLISKVRGDLTKVIEVYKLK